MNLDIDFLIKFYKNNTKSESKEEFTEQDAAAGASAPSGGSGKTPKKWESGRKFGKTYMNDPKYVWNSDVQRGHANSLFY
jgi:hypothetical protein